MLSCRIQALVEQVRAERTAGDAEGPGGAAESEEPLVHRAHYSGCGQLYAVIAVLLPALAAAGAAARPIGSNFQFSQSQRVGDRYMQITLCGTLALAPLPVDGLGARELSGLAWDADDALLYAISDAGYVVHLKPRFAEGVLSAAEFVAAHRLRDSSGRALSGRQKDAEGLVLLNGRNGLRGDGRLFVSFEQQPRLEAFAPDGRWLAAEPLPVNLRSPAAYAGRNLQLEALTHHPLYGFITAPERPLEASDAKSFTLYASSGKRWRYAPLDVDHSTLTGLETMPNGDLLVLERHYSSLFLPVVFAIRRLVLSDAGNADTLPVAEIARFDSSAGWAVDNFESLAWHEGGNYFMVSDDNASPWQSSLLVYFSIAPPGEHPEPAAARGQLCQPADGSALH